jgi:type III secretion protein J
MRLSPSLVLSLLLIGCASPVAGNLEEADANRVVLALDRAGVGASKESDPGMEGRFRVTVSRQDIAIALSALRAEELPREKPRGVLETVGKGSLIPSAAAEHAQIVAATGAEIQRSVESVEGVLSARVHIQVPPADPFATQHHKPTASVLVEHRGTTPPLPAEAIAKLVAGAVANLPAQDVNVVFVAGSAPMTAQATLSPLGPFSVARGSVRGMQLAGALLLALVAVFGVTASALALRLSRVQAQLASVLARGEM